MNWYHRGEGRYVEYGTSFRASRAFGIRQSLTDTIYNMNLEHLSAQTPTVFEPLDDADVRTAGTTYLMYRGRHEHQPAGETALARLATQVFRKPSTARASSSTPTCSRRGAPAAARSWACRACATGTPAASARTWSSTTCSTSCCFSLPDNDTHSHSNGPFAQVTSLAEADRQLERLMHAAGGPDAFLEDHAVIVCSDHSQSQVEAEIDLFKAFDGFDVLPATRTRAQRGAAEGEIALCPASRSAAGLPARPRRRDELAGRAERTLLALDGVDLVMRITDHPDGEAAVRGSAATRELRFGAGGDLEDLRGERWSVEGDLDLLELDRPRRPRRLRDLPGRARRGSGARCAAARAATCCLGRARLRVPRLGRRAPRRRRVARLAARQRLARLADLVRHRAGRRHPRAVVAARRRADGVRPLRRASPDARPAARWRAAAVFAVVAWAAPAQAQVGRHHPAERRARHPPQLRHAAARAPPHRDRGDRDRRAGAEAPGGAARLPARVRPCVPEGRARLAGLALRPAAEQHAAGGGRRRRSSTTAAAASRRRGPACRSRGRWRAATRARSAARSTRPRSGSACAWLFVLPFLRPPLRLLHLDLAVLLAFSVSYAFFGAAEPRRRRSRLAYPLLAYLLVRMLLAARARAVAAARCSSAPASSVAGIVFLLGFRLALNVTDGNVIDVGYAGVIGADRHHRRRPALRRASRSTTRTATRTGRSPTSPTCRSRRSGRGAATGTTCPRRTPPRSSSTSAAPRCCGCSAGACAGRARAAARLPVADLPVHAAGRELGRQRRAGGALVLAALLAASRPLARGALTASPG